MKNLKEEFDFTSFVQNFLGDKVRQVAGAVDILGDPVVYAALIKNYDELGDSLDKYENLMSQFKETEDKSNLMDELKVIKEDLEVDVVDITQGLIELTPTGPLGAIGSGLIGFIEKLVIEDIVEALKEYIPKDLGVPLLERMTDALYAIKTIEEIEKVSDEYEPIIDNPDKFMDNILEPVTEGRKKTGTKLCSRGKSAAKSKFDVYPSAYANGYAIQVCKGKIKGLDGKKRCSPPYC